MSQVIKIFDSLEYAEDGLKELVFLGWRSMDEGLPNGLPQLADKCQNLQKLTVSSMDMLANDSKKQIFKWTETIVQSCTDRLQILDLYGIAQHKSLDRHDASLIKSLHASTQLNRLVYLNLGENRNWISDTKGARLILEFIERQQCLAQLEFNENRRLSPALTVQLFATLCNS